MLVKIYPWIKNNLNNFPKLDFSTFNFICTCIIELDNVTDGDNLLGTL